MDELIKLYQAWLRGNTELPQDLGADELYHEHIGSPDQQRWLLAFIALWEAHVDFELETYQV